MNDMRSVIIPKSDQLNADDLLAGPRTITVERVTIRPGTEQPVSINFEGDGGKPYKPCKSMARVMVHAWGPDANEYVGRSMTLYCDPKVRWGGMEVGGIRISHMTHIDGTLVMALTETKGRRQPYKVLPLKQEAPPTLKQEAPPKSQTGAEKLAAWIGDGLPKLLAACASIADIEGTTDGKVYQAALGKASDEQKAEMQRLVDAAIARVSAPTDPDAFPGDLPSQQDAAE